MPNHITNVVTFTGPEDRVAILLKSIAGVCKGCGGACPEEGGKCETCGTISECGPHPIDFGRIVPEPPCLFHGDFGLKEEAEHPGRNWRDWCPRHWGTKWNAYDQSLKDGTLRFDTAWAMPDPIFRALAELFPEVTIAVDYADEDIGNNCGQVVYKGPVEYYANGRRTEVSVKDLGPPSDPVAFACDIHGMVVDDCVDCEKTVTKENWGGWVLIDDETRWRWRCGDCEDDRTATPTLAEIILGFVSAKGLTLDAITVSQLEDSLGPAEDAGHQYGVDLG